MKKVNEVSRLAGVSKRTLQFYDDEGLLPAQRSKDNYRLYDDAALERLWEILVYRAMGLDLKEIKDLLTLSEKQKNHVLIILVLELFIYAASGPPELILPEVTGTPSMTNKGSCEALNDPIPLMRILWLAPG